MATAIVEDEEARATRAGAEALAETLECASDVLLEAVAAVESLMRARGAVGEARSAARVYAIAETLFTEYGLRVAL